MDSIFWHPQQTYQSIKQQLQYVNRNIGHIHQLLKDHYSTNWPFKKHRYRDLQLFWVMQHIYDQQKYMFDKGVNSCPNRIVSLYQPYVRPIVRGKNKSKVEFGAKLNVSEINGFTRINQLNWEAYNESTYFVDCIEDYKEKYGYYPEVVLADSLYWNRINRNYCLLNGIRCSGKPLGRPKKIEETYYQRRKRIKEQNQRNHIEGKFGQAKNGYRLNEIRARRKDTSESWIAAIFFVMNVVKYALLAKKAIKKKAFTIYQLILDQLRTLMSQINGSQSMSYMSNVVI